MKNFAISLFCLVTIYVLPLKAIVSFQESMGPSYNHKNETKNLKVYRALYEKNANSKKILNTIPKIIHQIWIGPKKFPEKAKVLVETWKENHPDWKYVLWTDRDLDEFDFHSGRAFFEVTNMGMKVDILKYEILKKYGGVYIDIDFGCNKPLDSIVKHLEFFAGLLAHDDVGNGIIGASQNHPLIDEILFDIKNFDFSNHTDALKFPGPYYFSDKIAEYFFDIPDHVVIYPISYFHPFPATRRFLFWEGKISIGDVLKSYSKPETIGIHYWATSWQ